MSTDSTSFDLSIPQQYLDAIAAHEAKITQQMDVWKTYIAELSTSNTLQKLAKQINMLVKPLERELSTHRVMLEGIRQAAAL